MRRTLAFMFILIPVVSSIAYSQATMKSGRAELTDQERAAERQEAQAKEAQRKEAQAKIDKEWQEKMKATANKANSKARH